VGGIDLGSLDVVQMQAALAVDEGGTRREIPLSSLTRSLRHSGKELMSGGPVQQCSSAAGTSTLWRWPTSAPPSPTRYKPLAVHSPLPTRPPSARTAHRAIARPLHTRHPKRLAVGLLASRPPSSAARRTQSQSPPGNKTRPGEAGVSRCILPRQGGGSASPALQKGVHEFMHYMHVQYRASRRSS